MNCPDCGTKMEKFKSRERHYQHGRDNDLWICSNCGNEVEVTRREKS